MLARLDPKDRVLLLRFVCAFAWADGEVGDAERRFVRRLMEKVDLTDGERLDVESWLVDPPHADDVDPAAVPLARRRIFLDALRALIYVDGEVAPDERERFDALQRALSR